MGRMSFARVTTAVTAALFAVVAVASPASATTAPDTWPEDDYTALQWIATFIGGALLLIALIWIIAAAMNAKLRHFEPTIPSAAEIEQVAERDAISH